MAAVIAWPASALAQPVAADAPPSTPLEQVQALVQPAVVYEQITWSGYVFDKHNHQYFDSSKPITLSFQCTGFVVNSDGYVATAGHCVDFDQQVKNAFFAQAVDDAFAKDYYVNSPSKATIATFADDWRIDGQNHKGRPDQKVAVAYGVSVSGEPTGKAQPARVAALRSFDEGDVALLEIKAKDLTTVPLSDNSQTGVGTQIVSVGYPASVDLVTDANFNPSFKEGSISAEKTTQGGLLSVYEISAAVSGGMSGGPTAALDGQIIGVNSFKISGETQQFNFVHPSQTMQELMRGEGVENTLGHVTELYRAGLAAYFAGDRDAAISDFDQVLQIVPSHQFAQQYKTKAQALPASGPLSSNLVRIGVPLLLLAAIAVAVVVFLLIRRGRSGAPAMVGGLPDAPPPTGPAMAATSTASLREEQPSSNGSAATTSTAPLPTGNAGTGGGAGVRVEPKQEVSTQTGTDTRGTTQGAGAAEAAPRTTPPEAVGEVDLFCPNCGHRHVTDAHFCPHCGYDLTITG